MSIHARLSPSNTRWSVCPGSVREEANYPDIPGEAAIDGTGSHLQLEMALQNNVQAEVYNGEVIGLDHPDRSQGWIVHADRSERVQMCLDYVDRRVKELELEYGSDSIIKVESESKSNPGILFNRDDWHGTCDITISVIDSDHNCVFIEVIDYKDGRGFVNVNNNTQLISYLGGKIRPHIAAGSKLVENRKMNLNAPCRTTIVQPKTNPVVRFVDYKVQDILDEITRLSHAAKLTDDPKAPLIPDRKGGKGHCQWCKHKQNCTALAQSGANAMSELITVDEDKKLWEMVNTGSLDVGKMEPDKLSELADAKPAVMALFERIEAEIERRINAGQRVDGFAMLPGNSSHKWNDKEEVIAESLKKYKFKKSDMYITSFVSPAQALKFDKLKVKQKESLAKELISKIAGKKKLTKVARGSQDELTVEMMFGDVGQSKTNVVQLDSEISFI